MRVAILHDRIPEAGASPDQKDVLIQAEAVGRTLGELGHQCREFSFSMDLKALMDALKHWEPDLVFNLVESVEGSGRLIHLAPSILDFLEMPYTGSPTDAIYLTSNKLLTKRILTGAGVPTPEGLTMEEARHPDMPLKGVFIIKSVWEHASVGIGDDAVVSIQEPHQLFEAMAARGRNLGRACFAERFIEGREFNLSLLAGDQGPRVLPPAEIRFDAYPEGKYRIVDYKAKWDPDSFEYHHTQRSFDFDEREASLLDRLGDMAIRCWRLFGLKGYARVDFRVDEANDPWVLEINANPCLSPDAGFAAAAFRAGLDFKEVIRCIINDPNDFNG